MACAEREGLHTGPFSMEPGIATVVNEPDLATRQEIKKRLELSIPGVIFVRTLAPLSDLGRRAEAMTLPPLSAAAVYEWAQAAGLPPERADQLWEYSGGQPHLIADKLHATPDPLESHLSKTAVDPLELAKKLKLPPLELLDRLRPGLAAHRLRITSQGWLEKA